MQTVLSFVLPGNETQHCLVIKRDSSKKEYFGCFSWWRNWVVFHYQVEQMIILFVFSGNYINQLFAALVSVKWHSMKVNYKILTNHKNVPKKNFSDGSFDDKTRVVFNCHRENKR